VGIPVNVATVDSCRLAHPEVVGRSRCSLLSV
jgi:hypothetical protein